MKTYPPIAITARRQTVTVERALPFQGEVLVGHGKRVQPNTVVTRAASQERPFAWYVPGLVEIEGRETGVRLAKDIGAEVSAGEEIAVRKGFLGREHRFCPSPVDGTIVAADYARGHVIISPRPRQIELLAGVEGTVVEVISGRGALVAVAGLYCQGVAMAGDEAQGRLRLASTAPDAGLTLPANATDAVLAVGFLDEEGVAVAAAAGARAVVAGGASLAAWRGLVEGRWPRVTAMLLGGIGRFALDDRTYRELVAADGAPVLLAQRRTAVGPLGRPEMIVSFPGAVTAELDPPRFEPGARVRIVAGPDAGVTGTVSALDRPGQRPGPGRPASTTVVLAGAGRRVTVAVDAIELIG